MLYPALTPLALGDLYTLGIDIYGLHVTPEGIFPSVGLLLPCTGAPCPTEGNLVRLIKDIEGRL